MSGGGFDVELEREVIAAALRDVRFVQAAVPVLRHHSFSSRALGWIWQVISENYSKTREIPSVEIFQVRMERDFPRDEDYDFTAEVLVSMYARKNAAPRSALEEARRFARMTAIRNGAQAALQDLDQGDVDAALQAMCDGVGQARSADVLVERPTLADGYEERLAYYLDPDKPSVHTPLPTLDKLIGNGMPNAAVGLLVALTNVGKSAFAAALGHSAAASGAVVIHITTEESYGQSAARYDARLTRIDKGKLLYHGLNESEIETFRGRYKHAGQKLYKETRVQDIPSGSIAPLRTFAERAREENPDRMIAIIVDSPDHLNPPGRFESHRLSQSAVWWFLKGLVMDPVLQPICAWGTSQVQQTYIGKRLTVASAAESFDKPRIADVMVGLSEIEDAQAPDGLKRLDATLLKNRLGPTKHYIFHLQGDLGTSVFTEVASREADGDDTSFESV